MIGTFRHKGLKLLFETGSYRGVPAHMVDRIIRRLDVLEAAAAIRDLDQPGFGLHELMGARRGTWSVRVTGNWRITFTFRDGDAFDVDLEDYH